MNILFIHKNFPGQFRHVAAHLARNDRNTVYYLYEERRLGIDIPNVQHLRIPPGKKFHFNENEQPLDILAQHLDYSERYANAFLKLRKQGFIPDLIYDHPGWGTSLFLRDIFPEATYACFCEWYYTKDADFKFMARGKVRHPAEFVRPHLRNLCQLDALADCDIAITPTEWQRSTFPKKLSQNMHVLHDGIDTEFFHPNDKAKFALSDLDLSNAEEIVTYTARGLELYRGFPQFYHAIRDILAARPNCHIVIMAEDRVCYGPQPPDGIGYGERLRKEFPLDSSRVHFTGFRSYDEYRSLLQASTVHVYLTVPFVLSWSMLEAMSCGCLLVASDTDPVREVVGHEKNALLTDFWDHKKIGTTILDALSHSKKYRLLRKAARQTILDHYALHTLIPKHISLLENEVLRKRD